MGHSKAIWLVCIDSKPFSQVDLLLEMLKITRTVFAGALIPRKCGHPRVCMLVL